MLQDCISVWGLTSSGDQKTRTIHKGSLAPSLDDFRNPWSRTNVPMSRCMVHHWFESNGKSNCSSLGSPKTLSPYNIFFLHGGGGSWWWMKNKLISLLSMCSVRPGRHHVKYRQRIHENKKNEWLTLCTSYGHPTNRPYGQPIQVHDCSKSSFYHGIGIPLVLFIFKMKKKEK